MSAEELQAENARLKAEVERLDTLCKQVMAQHSDISCENITLRKAEVERLTWLQVELTNCKADADRFKAEVERLRASSFVTSVPAALYERIVHRNEALREAGDGLWYCLRHKGAVSPEERNDAAQEWQEARDLK